MGLSGETIDREKTKEIAQNFLNFVGIIGTAKIVDEVEGNIPVYQVKVTANKQKDVFSYLDIVKQGGQISL